MIQKDINGQFVAYCDGRLSDECQEYVDLDTADFRSAAEQVQRSGWRTQKGIDDQWKNFCPPCS